MCRSCRAYLSEDRGGYKDFVPAGLKNSLINSVSRMQVVDRKGNHRTPLASAICWKCCSDKKL